MHKYSAGLLIGLLVLMCSPGGGPVAGGDGDVTETGNAFVQGLVVDVQGVPVADAAVTLYKTAFNPVEETVPDSLTGTTNTSGWYVFPSVPADTYNVLARCGNPDAVMLIPAVLPVGGETTVVAADTVRSGRTLRIPLGGLAVGSGRYLYIPGTDVYVLIDSMPADSHAVLAGVPCTDSLRVRYLNQGGGDSLLYSGINTRGNSSDTTSCPGPHCQRHEP